MRKSPQEHLYGPHAFLQNIQHYLKPGGMLILGVPCVPRIRSLMKFKKFRGSLAGQHINFFTQDTLKLTVERGGWHVVEVRGFRFLNRWIDRLLDIIYPHFYVVATPNENFSYDAKRMRELAGYENLPE